MSGNELIIRHKLTNKAAGASISMSEGLHFAKKQSERAGIQKTAETIRT